MSTVLCDWEESDDCWGMVDESGALTVADSDGIAQVGTTPDQAMNMMMALAVAHGLSLHVSDGRSGRVLDRAGGA